MKVSALTEAARFLNQVREKRDGQGGSHPQQQGQQQKERDSVDEGLTPEKVSEAVASFGADAQAQENGLSATLEGAGPGLRVILRDVSGTVVRQFTGEEFVRLREAAGRNSRSRGKILDQKL